MRLLIACNAPSGDASMEGISESAVMDEAKAVLRAAQSLNCTAESIAIRSLGEAVEKVRAFKPDVIFNLCEGLNGDARFEMHMASLWELLGIPYTGNTPLTLGLAQNKVLTKRLFQSRNINTPVFQVAEQTPERSLLDFPLIVKPACEDASLGVHRHSVVHTFDALKSACDAIIPKYRQPALIEKFIPGREFNVSMIDHPARVLAISEIDFSRLDKNEPHITGYEAKWIKTDPVYRKTPAVCPAKIMIDLKKRLEDVALQVFRLLGGRDYGRVDMRVDAEGRIWVLEYNPNPDISPDAGYSKAIRAAGMTATDFVRSMITAAENRGKRHAASISP